jgi:phosphoglycerol transferase
MTVYFRGKRQYVFDLFGGVGSRQALAILLLAAFVISTLCTLRGFISTSPYVLNDEALYALQAKYANNLQAASANPLAATTLPNTLFLHFFRYTFAFGDDYLLLARVVNSLLFALAIFPIYGIARRVAPKPLAMLVSLVCAAAPANIYTMFFMPEAMYFLVFWVFVWVLVRWIDTRPIKAAFIGGLALGVLSLIKPHALQLLPITATVFILMAAFDRRTSSIGRTTLQVATIFGGVAIARAVLSFALIGRPEVFSVGPLYAALTERTLGGASSGLGTLLYGHLLAVSCLYALPLAVTTAGLLPGGLAEWHGNERVRRRFLLLFTALVLGVLITTASKFTVAIAGGGPFETATRLHGRYYNFALPLLLICFVSVHSSSVVPPGRNRRVVFALLCCVFAFVGLSEIWQLKSSTGSFVDYPEVAWFNLDHGLSRKVALSVIACATVLYAWRRPSRVVFLCIFGAISIFGTSRLTFFLRNNAHGAPIDRDGQAFAKLIQPSQMDAGLVAAAPQSVDVYRLLFYLPSASTVLFRDVPLGAADVPPDRKWIIDCNRTPVEAPVFRTVLGEQCNLLFLKSYPTPKQREPSRTLQSVYQFQSGGIAADRLRGFQLAEAWGVWSATEQPELRLPNAVDGRVRMILVASSLEAGQNNVLSVSLGDQSQTLTLTPTPREYSLHFALSHAADRVMFRGIHPRQPASLGMSKDDRLLGFGLAKLSFQPE